MRVNELEVGGPQGVADGLDAVEVMDVASSNDAFRTDDGGHFAHDFGNGFLVVVSVASEVVAHKEVDIAFEFFPHLGGLFRHAQGGACHEGKDCKSFHCRFLSV